MPSQEFYLPASESYLGASRMGQTPAEGAAEGNGTSQRVGNIILAVHGDLVEGLGEMRVQMRGCGEKPGAVRREVSCYSFSSSYFHNRDGTMPIKTVCR